MRLALLLSVVAACFSGILLLGNATNPLTVGLVTVGVYALHLFCKGSDRKAADRLYKKVTGRDPPPLD